MLSLFCDLSQTPLPFERFWEHTALALISNWPAQMQACHFELELEAGAFEKITERR